MRIHKKSNKSKFEVVLVEVGYAETITLEPKSSSGPPHEEVSHTLWSPRRFDPLHKSTKSAKTSGHRESMKLNLPLPSRIDHPAIVSARVETQQIDLDIEQPAPKTERSVRDYNLGSISDRLKKVKRVVVLFVEKAQEIYEELSVIDQK